MFRAYVEQCLVPALERGDVVVMDNFAAHKVPGVREGSIRRECVDHFILSEAHLRRILQLMPAITTKSERTHH